MTNEKVMFEFPVGSGHRWDAFDCLTQALYIPNTVKESKQSVFLMGRGDKRVEYTFDIMLEAGEFLEDFYKAKHTAQLKSQGWLSPEDQKPFCMASARELGVDFEDSQAVMTKYGPYKPFLKKWLNIKGGKFHLPAGDNLYSVTGGDMLWFMPTNEFGFPDPHEIRRLEALGVKRYKKGGE